LSRFGIEEPLEYTDEVLHEIGRWSAHTQQLTNNIDSAYQHFTLEQHDIFHIFVRAVQEGIPLFAFIDGKAGRGKTFLIDAIISYVRSIGKIAIVTATSAFAALLNLPFGGKIFACAGDFRQTCPVIRRGSKPQIIDASIRSSPLWDTFQVMRLSIPIRNASDPAFADHVDLIGDGAGPQVQIPFLGRVFTVEDAITFLYPPHILIEPIACLRRSILAPTNKQVDAYNDFVLDLLEGDEKLFYSADSLKEADEMDVVAPGAALDYAMRYPPPGLPSYALRIKVGGVYRLMRNLSIDKGLVKNTRCVINAIGLRVISVKLLKQNVSGEAYSDEDILIPRISFTASLPSSKYTLVRKQFPLAPAYATTFNSCQGLTLDKVVIDLTQPVFSHGQLYTALSRVRHRDHAKVRLNAGDTEVVNVTFHELLI
ncbi:hypothetical protein M422DRAFT_112442, partial [Sphaerobolus stellatus SS14]